MEPGFRWIKNPAAISPVWLEKPERIAALAMLTVVGLLVYAVIQRQVRLYLRDHARHIPGNKGPTATPTAAVVFALFTPVTLVHFAVDNAPLLEVHGLQDYHRLVCEAVGIDHAWYQGAAAGQNSLLATTPLERGFITDVETTIAPNQDVTVVETLHHRLADQAVLPKVHLST